MVILGQLKKGSFVRHLTGEVSRRSHSDIFQRQAVVRMQSTGATCALDMSGIMLHRLVVCIDQLSSTQGRRHH